MTDTFDASLISWVMDQAQIDNLCVAIETAIEVVIDLETTGLDEHATGKDKSWPCPARISLASLTLPQPDEEGDPSTFVVPLSHPDGPLRNVWVKVLRQICQTIVNYERPVVNQNMKFDSRWIFAHTGVNLAPLISWDTELAQHLQDENESTKLKEVVPRLFGITRWDDFNLSTPGASEKVPLFDLGLYAARDTYWTWKLAQYQRHLMFIGTQDEPEDSEEVQDARLGSLALWCSMPTVRTLASMEQRGIALDRDWVEARLAEDQRIESELSKVLISRYEIDGEPSFAATSNWFAAWSAAAVEAGDLRIGALTPTGKPQWSKSVLTRQARNGSEVATDLLALRKVIKEQEFLNSWLSYVTPDGLIHSTYYAGRNYQEWSSAAKGTVTGRLSSGSPNMQQVTKPLKPAFVPRPGFYFAELDYSQIELRLAAFVSRCKPMMQAFQEGQDLHQLTAAQTTSKSLADVTPAERQNAKAVNFGYVFGMSAEGFRDYAETSYGVILTDLEAVQSRVAFFELWDGMEDWHMRVMRRVRRDGQVVSPLGRVRRLPDVWSGSEYKVGHAERQAINSPVQSFASDLMQMSAASIEGMLPGVEPVPDVALVGTVHDSIMVEVPIHDWKRATARCMKRMMGMDEVLRRLGCDLDVPLGVEATVGTRWGLADIGIIS